MRFKTRRLVRPQLVPSELPFGPLPEPCIRFQDPLPKDASDDLFQECASQWLAETRREWNSLSGATRPYKAPYFRWECVPGPKASADTDECRTAMQWKTLARRVEDLQRIAEKPMDLSATKIALRHAKKSVQLVTAMVKGTTETDRVPALWLDTVMRNIANQKANTVKSLVRMARAKADKARAAEAKVAKDGFANWINGGKPKGGQPSKRAFLFVRGTVGWSRSPLGTEPTRDQIPIEDPHDLVTDYDQGQDFKDRRFVIRVSI